MPKFLLDTPNIPLKNTDETFKANKIILQDLLSNQNLPLTRKLIALSGKWGSGKSTVLHQLKESEQVHLETFDVWGVIEDQQFKRSFLTFLYRKLIDTNKKVSPKLPTTSNTPLLNAIKGHTSQTSIKTTSTWENSVKFLGVLFALSLLWGVCSSIVDAIAKLEIWHSPYANKANFLITLSLVNIFVISFLLLVNPPKEKKEKSCLCTVIAIVLIALLVTSGYWMKNWALFICLILLIMGVIVFYFLKDNTKQLWDNLPSYIFPFVSGSTADIKATSIETSQKDLGYDDFSLLYKQLLKYWKQTLGKKSLVIVIDNLDRLDTKDARLVIDQLSLFFTEESLDKLPICPWFILPIDKTKFFDNKSLSMEAEYFEKFFPIRLEISDISNAGWKKLLEDKLNEAFEDKENTLNSQRPFFSPSIELFRSLFYCYDMKLYPRDIIYFVNKVVYYYLVMEKIDTDNKKKNDWFKISFLTACYVMFVEERGGQPSPKEWFALPYDKNNTKSNQQVKIESYFGHYAIGWQVLLCMGYYQTLKPYDALYHGLIEELIKTGNKDELKTIRDDKFPSKDEFITLFKYVWSSMEPCLDMQTYVKTLKTGLEILK